MRLCINRIPTGSNIKHMKMENSINSPKHTHTQNPTPFLLYILRFQEISESSNKHIFPPKDYWGLMAMYHSCWH